MDKEKCLEIAFEIIGYAGEAKAFAYEALEFAEKGDYKKSDELMNEADKQLAGAHNIQTDLIAAETRGEHTEIGVLFVHAQDHLMTAIEAKNLIEKMIKIYKKIDKVK
eukprot:TRINITY_DN7972_c0_g1_i4.p1 TRINITY_DN7972_c0_g1~~TRINITY_DN7972_c0_g1_i4.p1  ORF type:complete len:108 (+),score=11.95 TRINITY_DN7972_c0_g1_i4:151-474(+)